VCAHNWQNQFGGLIRNILNGHSFESLTVFFPEFIYISAFKENVSLHSNQETEMKSLFSMA
jgi:hypothetical protein